MFFFLVKFFQTGFSSCNGVAPTANLVPRALPWKRGGGGVPRGRGCPTANKTIRVLRHVTKKETTMKSNYSNLKWKHEFRSVIFPPQKSYTGYYKRSPERKHDNHRSLWTGSLFGEKIARKEKFPARPRSTNALQSTISSHIRGRVCSSHNWVNRRGKK